MVPAAIFLHNLRLREHRLHAIPLKGVPYLTSRTILSNNQILTLSWQFIVELCVFRRSEPVDDMWLWGQRVFLWRVVVETHEMDGSSMTTTSNCATKSHKAPWLRVTLRWSAVARTQHSRWSTAILSGSNASWLKGGPLLATRKNVARYLHPTAPRKKPRLHVFPSCMSSKWAL